MKITALSASEPVIASPPVPFVFHDTTHDDPARTEVEDQYGQWLATFTNGARTVALRGQPRAFAQQDLPITDDFNRIQQGSGWGQATFGGKWSVSGGDEPGDYSVDGAAATMRLTTENIARRSTVNNSGIQNADITAALKTDKPADGSAQVAGVLMGYQNIDNHYVAQISFLPAGITDTFNRTATGEWGTTNSDQNWSNSGGATSDYSISNGTGLHSLTSANISRRSVLNSVDAADFDITVKVKTDVLASGASIAAGIIGRYTDSNNHYIFRLRFGSTGAHQVIAGIQKQEGGTVTTLGGEVTTSFTHTADTYFWIRARAEGTTLSMRVWQDGSPEPASWDVSLTDTAFTGGAIGVRSLLSTGNTNAPPVHFAYDEFKATLNHVTTDAVELRLRKRVAGTYTSIGPAFILTDRRASDDYFIIRAAMHDGVLQAKAWKQGQTEPSAWQVSANDTAYTAGKVGTRAICNIGTVNLPVTFYWDRFYADGTWTNVPTVTHGVWVRLLPAPFTGAVDETWLTAQLRNATPDILAIAMQYVTQAPTVAHSGLRLAGDSQYGPLSADGARQEGADFNDYLGIPWHYGSSTDNPETAQSGCMDCSGYVRMVYGYRGGIPLALSVTDGVAIPRVSSVIADHGPGIITIPNTGGQPADFSRLQPGDIVCFDADVTNPEEEEGQIDHNGIYLGIDAAGNYRFLSSRKTVNGPSLSDTGGPSIINGSTLYGRSLRLVRRF